MSSPAVSALPLVMCHESHHYNIITSGGGGNHQITRVSHDVTVGDYMQDTAGKRLLRQFQLVAANSARKVEISACGPV